MKVYAQGEPNPINLTQKNYVGEGGEGVIYAINNTAYKVYHDPTKMPPLAKIQELQAIQDARVIRPLSVLTDTHKRPIGYTMRFIRNAWSLCQIFPRSFRERNGISPAKIQNLVMQLQDLVSNVHKAKVLLVDANEMNFLVARHFDDIFGIDADSYQTPHFQATAIMPSIRDCSIEPKNFSELSDWYSFAIVSFQMFTGIHPYKGKHPTIKGLEERMQAGISVFDPNVRVPPVAYDFNIIPNTYRHWYEALFKRGERMPPPGAMGIVIALPRATKVTAGKTGLIEIIELKTGLNYEGQVLGFWNNANNCIIITDKAIWFNSGNLPAHRAGDSPQVLSGVGYTHSGWPVVAEHKDKIPVLYDAKHRCPIDFQLEALEVSSCGGNLYMRTHDTVYRIVLNAIGDQIIATTNKVAQTLEHASRLYPGCVIQKLLGAVHVSLLQGDISHQIRIKELDKYRIVDARFETPIEDDPQRGGILMVVGEKQGCYDRMVFRFDPLDYSYDVRYVKDIQPCGLNFVALPSGVCVCLNEDGHLEMCSIRKGSAQVKEVEDPSLNGDMHLFKQGNQLIVAQGNKLYTAKLLGGDGK